MNSEAAFSRHHETYNQAEATPRQRPAVQLLDGVVSIEPRAMWDENSEQTGLNADPVRQYLKEIGRYPLLDRADEIWIAKTYRLGCEARQLLELDPAGLDAAPPVAVTDAFLALQSDPGAIDRGSLTLRQIATSGEAARKQFIASNTRLVVSIAKKYTAANMPLLDLIQEGNFGLMRAVEKFDADRGFKFSTYATWWVRQAITRAIADKSRLIRLPVHMHETITKINRAEKAFIDEFGVEPTQEELAYTVSLSIDKLRDIKKNAVHEPVSLDAPISADSPNESYLGDFLEDTDAPRPEDIAVDGMRTKQLYEIMRGTLTKREITVLALRFGLLSGTPRTLEQTGEKFGLTRERIRQIEAKALSKLRHPSVNSSLRFD